MLGSVASFAHPLHGTSALYPRYNLYWLLHNCSSPLHVGVRSEVDVEVEVRVETTPRQESR